MTRSAMTALAAALLLGAAGLLAACAGPKSAALVHPEKVQGLPICTSCHDADRAAANHDARWMKIARRGRRCATSAPARCATRSRPAPTATATRRRSNPPTSASSRFDAATPHRGDWLTQHRVDGRLDPASCFPCHGRKNVGRCGTCHK